MQAPERTQDPDEGRRCGFAALLGQARAQGEALLSVAERFDTLQARAQQRVRRLIPRHRALAVAGAM